MKQYLSHHEWQIIENGFHAEHNRISESVFSIGNGRMGQRANFEETYTGDTLQGSYVAGVYYPDKTRVGWWKNGYPEYFAKVLNACNWIGIDIKINDTTLDLAKSEVTDFKRTLDMQRGVLQRQFTAKLTTGEQVQVDATRFCSLADDEAGAIRYAIQCDFSGELTISPYLDFDIKNEDANYDEKFWTEVELSIQKGEGYITAATRRTDFHVCTGMCFDILINEKNVTPDIDIFRREKYVSNTVKLQVNKGDVIVIYKYAVNLSSENHPKNILSDNAEKLIRKIQQKGFQTMLEEQTAAWAIRWKDSDVVIEGDVAAQQGIRFNIFQLHQTYSGEDERLNIGPKSFTGEKYGGSTYWDTEAYCLPFYLSTADRYVARNLLIYRYKHLQKAIENAEKLGFKDGAALYPMVTMNGEECHNEWEITFEEIHRNGAIAYAIFDYVRYTDDKAYLADYGLEVLVAIARFWAQRVNYSNEKGKYVILGVTGPNEYENNVNNNWYTNFTAKKCLELTIKSIGWVKKDCLEKYKAIVQKINFKEAEESQQWQQICDYIFLPEYKEFGIYLQQDGFLDKDISPVSDLAEVDRPICQKWSWDRILRSCYIKQADVLQGLYFYEHEFDEDTIRRNFDFYEPLTVHESSLSPCVHAILAARLGYHDKAYEMYLQTARLDLDDYNNDTEDGCHITSMAGTWMAVVKGFGGMRMMDGQLHLNPFLPRQWTSYSFKIRWRGSILNIKVTAAGTTVENEPEESVSLVLSGKLTEV